MISLLCEERFAGRAEHLCVRAGVGDGLAVADV